MFVFVCVKCPARENRWESPGYCVAQYQDEWHALRCRTNLKGVWLTVTVEPWERASWCSGSSSIHLTNAHDEEMWHVTLAARSHQSPLAISTFKQSLSPEHMVFPLLLMRWWLSKRHFFGGNPFQVGILCRLVRYSSATVGSCTYPYMHPYAPACTQGIQVILSLHGSKGGQNRTHLRPYPFD